MPKVNISCGEGESPHIIKDGMIDNGGRYEWIHKDTQTEIFDYLTRNF